MLRVFSGVFNGGLDWFFYGLKHHSTGFVLNLRFWRKYSAPNLRIECADSARVNMRIDPQIQHRATRVARVPSGPPALKFFFSFFERPWWKGNPVE